MKISELVKRTKVPKETIHYYIREKMLPMPRKRNRNTADYSEETAQQIELIKNLQTNFFLPLAEIKKILMKQKSLSLVDSARLKFMTANFNPIDRISFHPVRGRKAFLESTGLSPEWLDRMQAWGIITPEEKSDHTVFPQDDVIIGKLIVTMDHLGAGPTDGFCPEDLKRYSDFIKETIVPIHLQYLDTHLDRLESIEFQENGIKLMEAASLFFYHMYRKIIKEEVLKILNAVDGGQTSQSK